MEEDLSEKQKALQFMEEHKELICQWINEEHCTYLEVRNRLYDKYSKYIETWWIGEFSRNNRMLALKNKEERYISEYYFNKRNEKQNIKYENTLNKIEEDLNNKNEINIFNYIPYKLDYYHTKNICSCCGKEFDNEFNINYIDEDKDNILLTNIEKLCDSCYKENTQNKLPFVTVEVSHELQYGHRLPNYPGKCYFNHGHRGIVTIKVKRKINSNSGFAVDFNILKNIIKEEIDNVLDHEYLNNYMENPTTEFSVVWLWNKLSSVLKGIESISWSEGSKTKITLNKKDMLKSVQLGAYENEWIPEQYKNYFIK